MLIAKERKRANLKRFDVRIQPISHDSYQFRMDLVLVFLIILRKSEEFNETRTRDWNYDPSYTLQLIKFNQHDSLLLAEMSSESLPNIWNELEYNRERLRCEG